MKIRNKINGSHPAVILAVFLAVHFAVWVLAPMVRPNIPMDSVEAIVWGAEWSFGTNKHPFLGGWLAEISYGIFKNPDLSVYILSQLCVLLGFIYIYKTGRLFLPTSAALLGTLFLEGTIYYSACSIEYNVNVLSLAVVPMTVYCFYTAMEKDGFGRWCTLGVLMAAALMAKYTNGIVLIAMGLYLIGTKHGRGQFKKPGLYVAGAVCLAACLPHIWWLVRHDFYPFVYLTSRTALDTPPSFFISHFVWPVKFAAAQLVAMALTLGALLFLYVKAGAHKRPEFKKLPPFLFFTGILPLIIWILISAVAGIKLKSMWGFAFVSLIPVCVLYMMNLTVNERLKKAGVWLAYAMMAVMAAACIGTSLCHTSGRANFPGRVFAAQMKTLWQEKYQTPLKYTGGDIWFTSLLYVYLQDKPRVLIQMNPLAAPWIDMDDLQKHGAIVMADNMEEYRAFQSRVAGVPDPTIVPYRIKSKFGKEKTVMIHYGFLPPKGAGGGLYASSEKLPEKLSPENKQANKQIGAVRDTENPQTAPAIKTQKEGV